MKYLLAFTLLFSSQAYAGNCFIISENNKIIHFEGESDKRYSPCSTFKIPISLMAFDNEILIDETHPTWDFKSSYTDYLDRWKQPHNPQLWFANSCVWYSQIITKKLGIKVFSEYIRRFNEGNKDVSGDKNMNNGLSHCWLSSSLAISPREQISFLNKLVANSLPVSLNAQEKTKNIMYQETLPSGWQLYGKTGNGYQLDTEGNKVENRQVGWFVGFLKKEEKSLTFVQLIVDDDKQDSYASLRAKAALKKNIEPFVSSNCILQNNITLFDDDRAIPVAIYNDETQEKGKPVVFINHGYGVKNTEYSFIATRLDGVPFKDWTGYNVTLKTRSRRK